MSKVYRFDWSPEEMEYSPELGEFVTYKNFEAVQSERDALREELESNKTALREEMKDAFEFQQRNAGLVGLLTRTLAYYTESCFPEDLLVEVKIAIGSLKPPESGASELDPKIIGIIPMPPMEYDEP